MGQKGLSTLTVRACSLRRELCEINDARITELQRHVLKEAEVFYTQMLAGSQKPSMVIEICPGRSIQESTSAKLDWLLRTQDRTCIFELYYCSTSILSYNILGVLSIH